MEKVLLFAAEPIVLSNVLVKAPDSELALFLGEPACRAGKVGEEEEGKEGDEDGDRAFDDEEPTPSQGSVIGTVVEVKSCIPCAHVVTTVQAVDDASGDQA